MPCLQGRDRKRVDLETIGAHEIVCVDFLCVGKSMCDSYNSVICS